MSRDRIDCFSFWKALHHVVEHFSVSFVVEQLGAEEVIVDTFRSAVDTSYQPLFLPERFRFPLNIPHYQSHAGTALSLFVVGEIYDCDNSPPPVFLQRANRCANLCQCFGSLVQIHHAELFHVGQRRQLIQVIADGTQFLC